MIDKVQPVPRLTVSYPEPTPLEKLPAAARDVKFVANHYASLRGAQARLVKSFGEYTLAGPIEESLKPMPKEMNRITYVPVDGKYLGITSHGLAWYIARTNFIKPIELGLNLPLLRSPCDVTYDEKRKRLLVCSSAYRGCLYAYSIESQSWSAICRSPQGLNAFVYSPADDFIYGILSDHRDMHPWFVKMNAHGAIVDRFALSPHIATGILGSNMGFASRIQVAVAGKYVAIISCVLTGSKERLDPQGQRALCVR